MRRSADIRVDPYLKKKRGRKTWQKIVRVLACVVVFCTTYALILPAITMESDTNCGYEEHTHTDACYTAATTVTKQLVCGLAEAEAHTHGEGCFAPAHSHTDECCGTGEAVLSCGLEEAEAHSHGDGCYGEDGAVVCTLEETEGHSHTDECYTVPEVQFVCGLEERAEDTLVCTLEETEGHSHDDACYEGVVETGESVLTCAVPEHTHTERCYADLTDGELAEADMVITLIEAMPSADEIDAQIAEFEAAGDTEGEEAWLTDVYQQVAEAYYYYNRLSDEQKSVVTNADKLLELEYIWSQQSLAVTSDRLTIYQINSYDRSDGVFDGDSGAAVMVHGDGTKTVGEILDVPSTWQFLGWYAVFVDTVVENNTEYLKVTSIVGTSTNKLNYTPPANGYILLFYTGEVIPDTAVGDYVTINFTVPASGVETSSGYGTVSFSSISPINSATPTPTWYTSTKDFIELNLYDYTYGINARWENDTKYPGFQWNGGAYAKTSLRTEVSSADAGIPNNITDRNYIDSIDFGNSLITNFQYQGSNYAKSTTAIDVGKLYSNSGASSTGKINWLWYDGSDGSTTTNRPVGFSAQVTLNGSTVYTQSIANTLQGGYPALLDGSSLAYLFGGTTDSYVIKQNTESIDGLFQQDPVTGAYSYNSRLNHAQYSNNKFTLYEEIITPNFITYPFGNFLPFNTIDDSAQATQVGAFNYEGGMGKYVEALMEDLQDALDRDDDGNGTTADYADTSRKQLLTMLAEYKENWEYYPMNSSTYWHNLSPANAIRDYFFGDSSGKGDAPSDDDSFLTQAHLDQMYNIDWDVATNFFFGMEMKMNFYQPKDGLTGNDNDGDGTPDYPMEFYFTGDDDVWVYIDDVLFLDLTGIHRHVGGKIDFVNGKVYYYELDVENGGDVSETPYATYTFKQILEAAGASTAELNDKGTFEDYTIHSFNFYYMERGSGSSVCRLNFNFPLLRQNSITVEKELADDDSTAAIEALGNPDFLFQVLDADDGSLFIPEGWAYSLYDVDGSVIQQIEVTEKYQDGRVKTMVIKDGAGNELCAETYDADGNLKTRTGNGLDQVKRVGANGVFALKAGQKAEFVGIPETAGKYYVRELLDEMVAGQYGNITVSGTAVDPESVSVGGISYSGVNSPVLDMTNGSSTFRIKNTITTAKLGSLSISKILNADYSGDTDKTFDIQVTLDGQPLPEGTTYTVGGETRTVTVDKDSSGNVTASYVTIKAGETAKISNILAGTAFEVTETSGSAAGYTVTYTDSGGYTITIKDGAATGVIKTSANVQLVVTNTEKGATVVIPGTKALTAWDGAEHTYTFELTEVTDTAGETVKEGGLSGYTATAKVKDAAAAFEFSIAYAQVDMENLPATFYYRVTEQGSTDSLANTTLYVAEVTVSETADGIAAEVTGMWKDGVKISTLSADFVNTLTGSLTLSKTVSGGSSDAQFSFTITLDPGTSGAALPTSYPAIFYQQDGTVKETTVTLNGSNQIVLSGFKHGERAVIQGIPYGAAWTIEETDGDGYMVTTNVTVGGNATSGTGSTVSGSIVMGDTAVAYTNTMSYRLPETGGAGTTLYTMAGLGLMLLALCLMYSQRKRRKEAGFS